MPDLKTKPMTDKEALDWLAHGLNAEPIDAYRFSDAEMLRVALRATGRTVKDGQPAPIDTEPTSGY